MINLETIRAGLDNGEFFIEYLPIIELNQERCVGAEALRAKAFLEYFQSQA